MSDDTLFTSAEAVVQWAQSKIVENGYTVRYVEYCEDSRTPGLLGQIAGVTDREWKEVKIATHKKTPADLADILLHELHHVVDLDWDCGNRDVLGRGGK
jgi:hypothetical protein